MENSYGIGVRNRYELFYDDDVHPMDLVRQLEEKKKQDQAEKENRKNAANKVLPKKSPKTETSTKTKPTVTELPVPIKTVQPTAKTDLKTKLTEREEKNNKKNRLESEAHANHQEPNRGIKQNGEVHGKTQEATVTKSDEFKGKPNGDIRGNKCGKDFRGNKPDNDTRGPRRDDFGNNQDSGRDTFRGNKENEFRVKRQSDTDGQPDDFPPRFNSEIPRGRGRGIPRGRGRGRGSFNQETGGRFRRERDRQSGMVKSGVKPVDKRDGSGSFNWGSDRDQIEEQMNTDQPQEAMDTSNENMEKATESMTVEEENAMKEEESLKEMTLDEWKQLQNQHRAKPVFNLRKAGEGENQTQWKKTYILKKKESSEPQEIEDDGEDTHQTRRKKILEIDFQFSDTPVRGRGRGRGRGMARGRGGIPSRGTGRGRGGTGETRPEPPAVDNQAEFPSLG